MSTRSSTKLLLAVLALGATALVSGPASTARATESRTWNRVPMPPVVTFRSSPIWETIPGTRVSWVREQQRPNYDLFRYGSKYYIYNDGYWYRSDRLNQSFTVVDERYVPMAFSIVPTHHWRSYPPGWRNPKNPHYSGRHDNGRNAGNEYGRNPGSNGKDNPSDRAKSNGNKGAKGSR